MRKIFILMAMAIAVFSSCVDNDDNPMPTTTGIEQAENPTEDALSVTTEKTYVMYGEFDEDFGTALGRRLKGTMASPSNADIFVVDPSAVNQSGVMTVEELKTLIQRTESGGRGVGGGNSASPTGRRWLGFDEDGARGAFCMCMFSFFIHS